MTTDVDTTKLSSYVVSCQRCELWIRHKRGRGAPFEKFWKIIKTDSSYSEITFSGQIWVNYSPDVNIENHGLGQYGAEPDYSTLPFWQLGALKG